MNSGPRLFYRQVLELWDYQWNAVMQSYERVSFRALHVTEPDENLVDVTHNVEDLFSSNPISVQRRLDFPSEPPGVLPSRPPPPPPGEMQRAVPPPRPPPPNFGQRREPSPVSPAAIIESPESPDSSEPYSPTELPPKGSGHLLRHGRQTESTATDLCTWLGRTTCLPCLWIVQTILLGHHHRHFRLTTRHSSPLQSPSGEGRHQTLPDP